MMIAVCADRGAPGCTTTALALGTATAEPTVVVEADPYGGDLAVRCTPAGGHGDTFPPTPTVLTLAAQARTSIASSLVASRAHEFNGSTRVVPGHFSAEQAAGVKNWRPLADALRASSSRVVVDVGRIHSNSPTLPIVAVADVVVAVTRPEVGSVLHLKDRLERLAPVLASIRNAPPVLVPVVVAPKRISTAMVTDVGRMLAPSSVAGAIAGIGWLALDPEGVGAMYAGRTSGKDAKTPLLRSANVLCSQLDQAVNAAAPTEPVAAARGA